MKSQFEKSIDELKKYDRNSRKHSQKQINQIAASIAEFGFTIPILIDETNMVLAGHARLEAAKKIGMITVPVIQADGWSEAQKRAYIIADNKLALDSEWDFDLLQQELDDLKDFNIELDLTGFIASDIESINTKKENEKSMNNPPKEFKSVDYFDLDHKCPRCGFEFDDV